MPHTSVLADAVLLAHFAVVLFNIGGWLVVLVGHPLGWRIARRHGWRLVHLALVWFVAVETLLGYTCPLTTWEDALRAAPGGGSHSGAGFLQRWVSRLVYWDLPTWVFGGVYVLFAVAVTATYLRWPPSARSRP